MQLEHCNSFVFTYSQSRARHHIESVLKNRFTGTLISDGYKAYASYVARNTDITHANCWIHGRRGFEKAEDSEPDEVRLVLESIGHLYRVERQIQDAALCGDKKRAFRLKHSKPVVNQPIPLGRRNWLFCWTEIGAEHVGIIQSLIVTCKLHAVEPYTYLVDVLQRIAEHPASDVQALTPRLWKGRFAATPLRSVLYRVRQRDGP